MIANVKSVVACVRGSSEDRFVLEWASDEAVSRGADLRIVHARVAPATYLTLGAASVPLQRRRPPSPVADDDSRRVVGWAVEYVRNRHGDALTVDGEAIVGHTRDALIAESRRASVLVVGAHGHLQGLARLFESVSQGVLRHADCPVAVVPESLTVEPLAAVRPRDLTSTEQSARDALGGEVIPLRRRPGDQPEPA